MGLPSSSKPHLHQTYEIYAHHKVPKKTVIPIKIIRLILLIFDNLLVKFPLIRIINRKIMSFFNKYK
jgi:hypothetical protein